VKIKDKDVELFDTSTSLDVDVDNLELTDYTGHSKPTYPPAARVGQVDSRNYILIFLMILSFTKLNLIHGA
jgi:hypothetical protein